MTLKSKEDEYLSNSKTNRFLDFTHLSLVISPRYRVVLEAAVDRRICVLNDVELGVLAYEDDDEVWKLVVGRGEGEAVGFISIAGLFCFENKWWEKFVDDNEVGNMRESVARIDWTWLGKYFGM